MKTRTRTSSRVDFVFLIGFGVPEAHWFFAVGWHIHFWTPHSVGS